MKPTIEHERENIVKQDFNFNGKTINAEFTIDANFDALDIKSHFMAEAASNAIKKIKQENGVRFAFYGDEFTINSVTYHNLCIEFRWLDNSFGSPRIMARRCDRFGEGFSDAARKQIVKELVPQLLDFAKANREAARDELVQWYKNHATQTIAKAMEQFEAVNSALKAA